LLESTEPNTIRPETPTSATPDRLEPKRRRLSSIKQEANVKEALPKVDSWLESDFHFP